MWERNPLPTFVDLVADVPTELVVAVWHRFIVRIPSHLVVFGHDGFHPDSCLQLSRCAMPCRLYFALLVKIIEETHAPTEVDCAHTLNGACLHNCWHQSEDRNNLSWNESKVLITSDLDQGTKGTTDKNCWDPAFDETSDGGHCSESIARTAQDRATSDTC